MAFFRSKGSKEVASGVREKVKTKTLFIKMLAEDAATLVSQSQSDEIKEEITKVYEAIRFSNPMSNDVLSDIEAKITLKFSELQEAVEQNEVATVRSLANELIVLIKDRNNKCKLLN